MAKVTIRTNLQANVYWMISARNHHFSTLFINQVDHWANAFACSRT